MQERQWLVGRSNQLAAGQKQQHRGEERRQLRSCSGVDSPGQAPATHCRQPGKKPCLCSSAGLASPTFTALQEVASQVRACVLASIN